MNSSALYFKQIHFIYLLIITPFTLYLLLRSLPCLFRQINLSFFNLFYKRLKIAEMGIFKKSCSSLFNNNNNNNNNKYIFVYNPVMKTERNISLAHLICCRLSLTHYYSFFRRVKNFVFVLSARTNSQYY